MFVFPRESVDVEHYVHEKSFRSRLNLLTLRNSKIGESGSSIAYSLHVRILSSTSLSKLPLPQEFACDWRAPLCCSLAAYCMWWREPTLTTSK